MWLIILIEAVIALFALMTFDALCCDAEEMEEPIESTESKKERLNMKVWERRWKRLCIALKKTKKGAPLNCAIAFVYFVCTLIISLEKYGSGYAFGIIIVYALTIVFTIMAALKSVGKIVLPLSAVAAIALVEAMFFFQIRAAGSKLVALCHITNNISWKIFATVIPVGVVLFAGTIIAIVFMFPENELVPGEEIAEAKSKKSEDSTKEDTEDATSSFYDYAMKKSEGTTEESEEDTEESEDLMEEDTEDVTSSFYDYAMKASSEGL